jgi:hypothetical protein
MTLKAMVLTGLSLAVILTTGCGGIALTGGGNQASSKRDGSTSASGDETASDPQVVTGAYLACEISKKDTLSAGNTAVGCNLMSNSRRVAAQLPIKISYKSVYENTSKAPDKSATASGYQALFSTPAVQLPKTQYVAEVFNGGTKIKELQCSGSQLPCTAALNVTSLLQLTASGVWSADRDFGDAASKAAFQPQCPNNPDLYCNGDGSLQSKAPSAIADRESREHCMSDSQKIVGSIIKGVTMGMYDPMKAFGSVAKPVNGFELKKGEACVMSKIPRVGKPAALANVGSGCYVILLNKGGQAINVIIPKSRVDDGEALNQILAGFQCK